MIQHIKKTKLKNKEITTEIRIDASHQFINNVKTFHSLLFSSNETINIKIFDADNDHKIKNQQDRFPDRRNEIELLIREEISNFRDFHKEMERTKTKSLCD